MSWLSTAAAESLNAHTVSSGERHRLSGPSVRVITSPRKITYLVAGGRVGINELLHKKIEQGRGKGNWGDESSYGEELGSYGEGSG